MFVVVVVVVAQGDEELAGDGGWEHGFGADGRGGFLHFGGELNAPFLAEGDDDAEATPGEAAVRRHFS